MTAPSPAPSQGPGQLPVLPGRGRTYAFLAGAVATLLTMSVAIPLALGDRPQSGAQGDSLAVGQIAGAPGGITPGAPLTGSAAPDAGGSLAGGGPVTDAPAAGPRSAGQTGAGLVGGSGGSGTGGDAAAGAPGSGSASASGGGTGKAAAPVARTASDQGVTATTLTVGAFLIDFGRASDAGATVPGYDTAAQKRYVDAYVKGTNARGGIGGRTLVVKYRKVDITDQQTMRDACTSFGQTDRVFAVLQVLGVYGDPILKCAVDQKLPFLSNDGAVSSYYPAAKGYLITTQPSTRRTVLNMEYELNRIGEFKGKKLGVLYEDGYLAPDSKAVVTALKGHGYTAVEGVTSSSDVALALRQLPIIAQDFCSKGVDYVLLLVNELYADQFHSNAERFANCRPSYAVSDFDFQMNGDAFLDGQNDSFFNRLLSVTSGRVGEGRVGKPEPAADATCRQTFERQTGSRLNRNAADSNYFNALAVCGLTTVLQRGVEAAGVNPTRDSFVRAVGGIGAFSNPAYGPSAFTSSRYDAPEAVRISRAFLSCKCWKPQTDLFAAHFR